MTTSTDAKARSIAAAVAWFMAGVGSALLIVVALRYFAPQKEDPTLVCWADDHHEYVIAKGGNAMLHAAGCLNPTCVARRTKAND